MRKIIAGCLSTLVLIATQNLAAAAPADKPAVNGESLTDTTRPNGPAEQFGQKGQIALSSDNALLISNKSISGASGSTTTIELQPAVDYFFIHNVSLGGFLEFNYSSTGDSHSTAFGIGPRVGYNVTLSDLLSIWPKAGLSISSTSVTTPTTPPAGSPPPPAGGTTSTTVSGTNVALNLFVPLMIHPAPHFFAGFGPFLDTDLSGDAKATTFGAKLTIGGWLL